MRKGYLYPKRALRNTDVLHTEELNEDFIPAAERVSGNLNAHNFDAGISASLTMDDNAFYRDIHTNVTSDHGIVNGGVPNPAAVDVFRLPNDREWHRIGGMSITITTAQALLWLYGWAQSFWALSATTSLVISPPPAFYLGVGARVAYALRVDGHIITSTITGQHDETRRNFWAIRATPQFDLTAAAAVQNKPGAGIPRTETASSIGAHGIPVRVGAVWPVGAGQHVIELLARVVLDRSRFNFPVNPADHIDVYNRRLFAVIIPQWPQATTSLASVDAPAFETEDVFSAASIGTSRIDAVRTAYNAVAEGACARGCFNHNHLPTAVVAGQFAQTAFSGAAGQTATNSIYPGFGSSTIVASGTVSPALVGWTELVDGGGVTTIRNDNGGAPAGFAANPTGVTLVLANIELLQLDDLSGGAGPNTDSNQRSYGMFAIGHQRDATGTPLVVSSSEGFVNSFNLMHEDSAQMDDRNVNVNIPLMFVDVNPPETDWYSIYVSSTSGQGHADGAELVYQRANLMVLQLR